MEAVREFLKFAKLEQYEELFEARGYDQLAFLMRLSEKKLRMTMKKLKMLDGHADRLVEAMELHKKKLDLFLWTFPKNVVRTKCHHLHQPKLLENSLNMSKKEVNSWLSPANTQLVKGVPHNWTENVLEVFGKYFFVPTFLP